MNDQPRPADGIGVRVDLWLWAARFFKTRSLARQAIETGKVELDGQRPKPSRLVQPGQRMSVTRGVERFELTILATSDQRGPAPVARQLYAEDAASVQARSEARALAAAARAGYQPPETRPDKRARRLIRALGDIDAL